MTTSLVADGLLVVVAVVCTALLIRKRGNISKEFQKSWRSVIAGMYCANIGLMLNLTRDYEGLSRFLVTGPTDANLILKTLFYVLCMLLVFNGVRQWYPLILAVQRSGVQKARLYRKLVEEANSIFLRWDSQGRIVSINRYGEELFGYSRHELVGKPVVGTIVADKDAEGFDLAAMIEDIRRNPESYRHNENENITRDGQHVWIAWRNAYITEGQNGEPELLSIGVDMTGRKLMEEAIYALASSISYGEGEDGSLGDTMRHLAKAYGVKYAFYAVYADDERQSMRILAMWNGQEVVSGMVYDLEGTPCKDVLARKMDVVEDNLQQSYPKDGFLKKRDVKSYFGTVLQDASGDVIGVISVMDTRPMRLLELSRSVLYVFADRISGELERRHAEEDIYRLAHYDALTGLPNRLLFHDRLEQALAHADRNKQLVALLFLDLDRFKHVNDSIGHAGGDILLKEVATRLQDCVRESDTVARMGGDEFIVLLSDFSSEEEMLKTTSIMADEFVRVISRPFHIESMEFYVSVSIGITAFPQDGSNIDYLIRNADIAMYHAKDKGRNRYEYYHARMNEIAEKRSRMESELRVAVDKDQLRLWYQPVVDAENGRILWFEALLRWQHPEHGLVMPEDFIALAEESGLILSIGEWVIEEVCRQLAAWKQIGLPVNTLALNLSMRQLERPGLIATLERLTRQYGVSAEQLILEITESMLMEDPERTLPVIRTLSEQGYALAMDDFGTGYSSFGQLQRLNVDSLKIDRGFVLRLGEGDSAESIVSAIIGMARELGMRVVAEGVESREQMDFLRRQGCHLIQGFYTGYPMEAEACEQYARAEKPPWHEANT
ncbi:sensor domain-containing protein [Thiolapillus brandeum]|uniref:cyclic-guanylate-specific phosphodiesterase n=1 Tax=Thiolapillus brandeum TaxID=1076588 RepID=A0A7U6JJ19_9GAMM|nr:EAL domain-containing protein [Thiolapillus brandeum]BAO44740.1 signal transduction protein [Thiolapillus brandeum]